MDTDSDSLLATVRFLHDRLSPGGMQIMFTEVRLAGNQTEALSFAAEHFGVFADAVDVRMVYDHSWAVQNLVNRKSIGESKCTRT